MTNEGYQPKEELKTEPPKTGTGVPKKNECKIYLCVIFDSYKVPYRVIKM